MTEVSRCADVQQGLSCHDSSHLYMTAMLAYFSSCHDKQQCFEWWAQEELRLVYAELHAVAHTQKETIAKVEARWEKAVGRTQLLLKGQPSQAMTKQVIKELQHQPLQVTSNLCGASLVTLSCHWHAHVGDQNAMHLRCFFHMIPRCMQDIHIGVFAAVG